MNARDARGFTALHRAAELGHVDVCQALLDRGAALAVEAEGHTARTLALAGKHDGILALLNR